MTSPAKQQKKPEELAGFCVTTTGSLSRTGAGNPHHWLAGDPTGSLNRTGTGQNFCTGEIRFLSGHNVRRVIITGTGRPGGQQLL